MEALEDFMTNNPTKKPLRDKKMKQGLGKLNPRNLDAMLAADEITQDEYNEAKKLLKGKEVES